MTVGKVSALGVSILLAVGVCVAVFLGTKQNGSSDGQVSTTSKAVQTICSPTQYKDACVNSLSSVAQNESVTPKDLIQAAFAAALKEVQAGLNHSGTIGKGVTDPTQKMAVEDCQDLLKYAVDELQASFSMVGDNDLHTMNERVYELQNWLSAVISYQQTCMDGVTQPDLQKQMSNGLVNATQLTSNALAIVSEISGILATFNLPINNTASSRRLLETQEDNYPSWFSHADRKLMASQAQGKATPNAVVAKDGSGQYKTIAAALAAYPKNNKGRYVIYVKAGIYDEYITITKDQVNIFMYGDGPRKTMITGKKSFASGVSTFRTATFSVIGSGFMAKSMGFQNTAGPTGHQAVALRVQSDMASFFNCRMDGYQDTLYTQTHRQFYRNCVISGTIDFIFGDAAAVIQNSLIIVRKPMDNQQNTVTAHGRTDPHETTGLVIQNCRIVPEEKLYPVRTKIRSYLGRPWKEYSRTVIMESTIGDLIQPAGWMPWNGNFALDTLYYAEYANKGPGANTSGRVKWKGYKVLGNQNQALQFTAGQFIQGNRWLQPTGIPHFLGLKNN